MVDPLRLETTAQALGRPGAREAVAAGADVVVVAGGDGTVRAVAEVLAGTGVALGLVPSGTGNPLARNLGVPLRDGAASVRAVCEGEDPPSTWAASRWTAPVREPGLPQVQYGG